MYRFILLLLISPVFAGLEVTPLSEEINDVNYFDLEINNVDFPCDLEYHLIKDNVIYYSTGELIEYSQKIRRNFDVGDLPEGYIELSCNLYCLNNNYSVSNYLYNSPLEKPLNKYTVSFNLTQEVNLVITSSDSVIYQNIIGETKYIELYEGNYTIHLSKKNYIPISKEVFIDDNVVFQFKLEEDLIARNMPNLYKLIIVILILFVVFLLIEK